MFQAGPNLHRNFVVARVRNASKFQSRAASLIFW